MPLEETVQKRIENEQTRTVKGTIGSDSFTAQTRYDLFNIQKKFSLNDRMEARKMCLSFCYAGRNGHCASAGTDNNQVRDCLAIFRQEARGGES